LVLTGVDLTSYGADLPDMVGGPLEINHNPRNGEPYFNTSLFSLPSLGSAGDAPHRLFYGPGIVNFDMALAKVVRLGETRSLQFRLETFNTFNHTQFRIYDSNLGNQSNNTVSCYGGPNAGYSAAGGDGVDCLTGSAFLHPVNAHRPRTVQFGVKYSF